MGAGLAQVPVAWEPRFRGLHAPSSLPPGTRGGLLEREGAQPVPPWSLDVLFVRAERRGGVSGGRQPSGSQQQEGPESPARGALAATAPASSFPSLGEPVCSSGKHVYASRRPAKIKMSPSFLLNFSRLKFPPENRRSPWLLLSQAAKCQSIERKRNLIFPGRCVQLSRRRWRLWPDARVLEASGWLSNGSWSGVRFCRRFSHEPSEDRDDSTLGPEIICS